MSPNQYLHRLPILLWFIVLTCTTSTVQAVDLFGHKAILSETSCQFDPDSTEQLIISSACIGDSLVRFTIQAAASSPKNQSWDYIVIEDVMLRETGTINIGEEPTIIEWKGKGQDIRLAIPKASSHGDTLFALIQNCGAASPEERANTTIQLDAKGTCIGDSVVRFVVQNVGAMDMTTFVDFIVIEDVMLRESGTIQLPSMDSTLLLFPAKGKTLHLQIPQQYDTISVVVHGCGESLNTEILGKSEAYIQATGVCKGDSVVCFSLTNTGADMSEALDFIVIEDVMLREKGTYQLPGQDSLLIQYKSLGQDFKLNLQVPPTQSDTFLKIHVWGCGAEMSLPNDTSSLKDDLKKRNKSAIGLMAGTVGVGLSFTRSISDHWSMRLQGTHVSLSIKPDWSYSELAELNAEAQSTMVGILADWYPSKKSPYSRFHFTAGLFGSFSKLTAYAAPNADALLNHPCKDEFVLGEARLTIQPQTINPYMGLGFGRLPKNHRKIGLKLDLGLFYVGKPKVDLVTSGAIKPTQSQGAVIADNLSDYRWLPNANLTLAYSF